MMNSMMTIRSNPDAILGLLRAAAASVRRLRKRKTKGGGDSGLLGARRRRRLYSLARSLTRSAIAFDFRIVLHLLFTNHRRPRIDEWYAAEADTDND